MTVIYICIFLLCVFLSILLGWRYYREYMVRKVAQQTELDALGKRKLLLFKHKLREEHLFVLLAVSGGIVLSLLLFTIVQLSYGNQLKHLTVANKQMKEEITDIRQEYAELIQMPLFSYPSNGFSFDAIDWERLLVANNNEERFTAEYELAYQLSPFLGRTMILIFIDQPMQEIALTLSSKLMTKEDLVLWEENWQRILDDMVSATLITQATFSVQVSGDIENSFEQTVVRENEQWDLLTRRHLILDKVEDIDEELDAPDNEQEETNEQKGSVKIDTEEKD